MLVLIQASCEVEAESPQQAQELVEEELPSYEVEDWNVEGVVEHGW